MLTAGKVDEITSIKSSEFPKDGENGDMLVINAKDKDNVSCVG